MTVEAARRTQDAKEELLRVFVDGSCVDLDIGWPRFERRLDAKDLGLDQSEVPEIFRLGHKLLISKKVLAVFASLEGMGRRNIEFYSFTFPIPGIRFVPHRVLPQLVEELEGIKSKFEDRAKEFAGKYYKLRDETLTQYTRHREAIEKLYPPKDEVARGFHFTWSLFNISLPTRLQRKAVDLKMTQEAKVKADSIIATKTQEMVTGFDKWAEEIVKGARAAAAQLFTTVRDKMRGGAVIHSRSVESLREHIDHFRAMNVVQDGELEATLMQARGCLDGAETKFGRAAFEEAVAAVVKVASDVSDVSEVTGSYRRRLLEV